MKRYGNLYQQICNKQNINVAFENVLSSLRAKQKGRVALQQLIHHLEENKERTIDILQQQLLTETYTFGQLKTFKVYEPKERDIHTPPLMDKFLHHALMNVIKPYLKSKFTADSYGSIEGMGKEKAAHKLQREIGNYRYFLQIDCRKFYESIDHDVMKAEISRVIKDKRVLRMIDEIIDKCENGLAIGVFPSQYLANLLLARIDHYAKEVLKVKAYYRYMDDVLILTQSKEEAQSILASLRPLYEQRKLTIKNNLRIAPIEYGIDIWGWKFYPEHARIRKRIKLNFKRKAARAIKHAERYCHTEQEKIRYVKQQVAAYWGMFKAIDEGCWHLWETTLGKYANCMQYKETKPKDWFGVPEENRVSATQLIQTGQDIAIRAIHNVTIRGDEKQVYIFTYANDTTQHCFISQGYALADKVRKFFAAYPNETLECKLVERVSEKTKRKFISIE